MLIDTSFDFRTDAAGPDPDSDSPTLRRYHRLLWSKLLPGGVAFDLDETTPGEYLHHRSELGEFYLSSDAVIPDYQGSAGMKPVIDQLTASEVESFIAITYTIGGTVIFPSNRIGSKMTINGARGFHPRIRDRFDLTLECIRRHYQGGQPNPLDAVLARYGDFFALFDDFPGYVDFFHLQDLVAADCSKVRFSLPFDDFETSPLPRDAGRLPQDARRCTEFINARNHRIADWAARTS